MDSSNLLITVGAAFVVGGIVLLAAEAMRSGRLSDAAHRGPEAGATLEPSRQARVFSLKRSWPGLTLVATGLIFLLATSIM
jgi:hypothetical protein